jgi:DNA-binding FrmR family transcriptional regulator
MENNNIPIRKTIRHEDQKKKIINRLNRMEGQIKGIKKMIGEDRYCDDVLIQLSAIDKSIKSLENVIIENHIQECVLNNIERGNLEIIDEVIQLFRRFSS